MILIPFPTLSVRENSSFSALLRLSLIIPFSSFISVETSPLRAPKGEETEINTQQRDNNEFPWQSLPYSNDPSSALTDQWMKSERRVGEAAFQNCDRFSKGEGEKWA